MKEVFKRINDDPKLKTILRDNVKQHQSMISHRHIIPLYGVFEDSGRYYFLTELCESNLRTKMKEPLREDIAIKYIKNLLFGLEILHYNRIIHGCIKP